MDVQELFGTIPVVQRRVPVPQPPSRWDVFHPELSDEDGIIGAGADLEPSTLIAAYSSGVFPWPHGDWLPWFSPDPRAVIPAGGLHVSRRLARTIRQGRFRLTINADFREVMRGCAERGDEGTWVTPEMVEAYCRLHELGWAHSVEAWDGAGELAGGLYGISIGAFFAAESMFHRQRDASKVALLGLMAHCARAGIELVDIQILTPHTASMGAVEVSRAEYLRRLGEAVRTDVRFARP